MESVCQNPLCQVPHGLGHGFQTRNINGTNKSLCSACVCEVDHGRWCKTCSEIFVAAKASPEAWSICTRCSKGVHFPCSNMPVCTDYISSSFLCPECKVVRDREEINNPSNMRDRVCGNIVCHKPNSSRWVRRIYQGKLQWLCSACGACLDSGKCCQFCYQIYRQGDADNFDRKDWIGCDVCSRWVHAHCDLVMGNSVVALCFNDPGKHAYSCPSCRNRSATPLFLPDGKTTKSRHKSERTEKKVEKEEKSEDYSYVSRTQAKRGRKKKLSRYENFSPSDDIRLAERSDEKRAPSIPNRYMYGRVIDSKRRRKAPSRTSRSIARVRRQSNEADSDDEESEIYDENVEDADPSDSMLLLANSAAVDASEDDGWPSPIGNPLNLPPNSVSMISSTNIGSTASMPFLTFGDKKITWRKIKEDMAESIWIRCAIQKCKKWRKLPSIFNFQEFLAEYQCAWNCSMNNFDPEKNQCSISEEVLPQDARIVHVEFRSEDAKYNSNRSRFLTARAHLFTSLGLPLPSLPCPIQIPPAEMHAPYCPTAEVDLYMLYKRVAALGGWNGCPWWDVMSSMPICAYMGSIPNPIQWISGVYYHGLYPMELHYLHKVSVTDLRARLMQHDSQSPYRPPLSPYRFSPYSSPFYPPVSPSLNSVFTLNKTINSPSSRTCKECGQSGRVLCCGLCQNAIHPQCSSAELMALPSGVWVCSTCIPNTAQVVPLSSLRNSRSLISPGNSPSLNATTVSNVNVPSTMPLGMPALSSKNAVTSNSMSSLNAAVISAKERLNVSPSSALELMKSNRKSSASMEIIKKETPPFPNAHSNMTTPPMTSMSFASSSTLSLPRSNHQSPFLFPQFASYSASYTSPLVRQPYPHPPSPMVQPLPHSSLQNLPATRPYHFASPSPRLMPTFAINSNNPSPNFMALSAKESDASILSSLHSQNV